MPTIYAGADVYPTSLTLPSDGDLKSAAVTAAALEGLADRATWLKARLLLGNHVIQLVGPFYNKDSRFSMSSTGWQQTDITDAGMLRFYLPSPIGGQLDSVNLIIDGAGGAGHGALPATMPRVRVSVLSFLDRTITELGNAVDPSATVSAYEGIASGGPHAVTVSGLAHAIHPTNEQLIVSLEGETGANAVANAVRLFGARMVVSYP